MMQFDDDVICYHEVLSDVVSLKRETVSQVTLCCSFTAVLGQKRDQREITVTSPCDLNDISDVVM